MILFSITFYKESFILDSFEINVDENGFCCGFQKPGVSFINTLMQAASALVYFKTELPHVCQ
jgi:hypothetical protein